MVERQSKTNMLLILYDLYCFLALIALKLAQFNAHGEVGTGKSNWVQQTNCVQVMLFVFTCLCVYIHKVKIENDTWAHVDRTTSHLFLFLFVQKPESPGTEQEQEQTVKMSPSKLTQSSSSTARSEEVNGLQYLINFM